MLCARFTPETTAQFLAKVRRCLRGIRIDLVMDKMRRIIREPSWRRLWRVVVLWAIGYHLIARR